MEPLYLNGPEILTAKNFAHALRKSGIRGGDELFIHSNIGAFGKLAQDNPRMVMNALIQAFEESVSPEGTIVMPTFTYSFCNKLPYDRALSKSTVGALTNFFRTQRGVIRSIHPLFSVAALGAARDAYIQTTKDSFGPGTVFDTLHARNAKIVFFGASFSKSCTFGHHLEQMAQVPYRFLKTFTGSIIDGDHMFEDSYTYFVRPLDGSVTLNLTRLESQLREKRLLQEINVGRGTIGVVTATDLFDEGMACLSQDPYFLVDRNSPVSA